jgi:hypothetical protein
VRTAEVEAGPTGKEGGEMKNVDWVRTLTDEQLIEWRDKLGDAQGADGLKLIRINDEIDRRKAAKRG